MAAPDAQEVLDDAWVLVSEVSVADLSDDDSNGAQPWVSCQPRRLDDKQTLPLLSSADADARKALSLPAPELMPSMPGQRRRRHRRVLYRFLEHEQHERLDLNRAGWESSFCVYSALRRGFLPGMRPRI